MIDRTRLAEWIKHIFDHPVTDPAWFFGENVPLWRGPDDQVAVLIAVTFEQSGDLLQSFSEGQLAHGFGFLLSAGASGYTNTLREGEVPWPTRQRAIRSFAAVFEQIMQPRCPLLLLSADDEGTNPLNECSYIWWDNLGWDSEIWGEDFSDPHQSEFDNEVFDVLRRILRMPHDGCRESALHGLSHWCKRDLARAAGIIDEFLRDTPGLRPELIEFANYAREGRVS